MNAYHVSINFAPQSVVETCPDCKVVPCPKHSHQGILQTDSFEMVNMVKTLLSNGGTYKVEVAVNRPAPADTPPAA